MSRVVGVDCGLRHCGVGLFENSTLTATALIRSGFKGKDQLRAALAMGQAVRSWVEAMGADQVVIEVMKHRPPGQQKGPQQDLAGLTLVGGMIAADHNATLYYPEDWKTQLDGDDFIVNRIIPRLSVAELAVLRATDCPESLAHNVADGVGIALKYLGRLEPVRVFHKE